MKSKINAFLMKEGVKRTGVLTKNANVTHVPFHLGEFHYDFYWNISNSKPKWLNLFSDITQVQTEQMRSRNVQGLLVLEMHQRIFCFTFGHSRHLIDPLMIERYFGLKVALGLSDPDLIKSIDKSNIDKIPVRSRSQSSQYKSISQFEFKFDWEILKSLTGIVDSEQGENEHDYEVVTGSDAVTITTEISLAEIPKLVDRMLVAYRDDTYKQKFPWIDYIVPARDKELINQLDQAILNKINNSEFDDVWIAPPSIIDYENFSGFCYRHRNTKSSQVIYHDLHLSQCLMDKKKIGGLDIREAKTTHIYLHNADDQQIGSWTLYSCLNGEIELDGKLYILNEGSWYQIEREFCAQINRYFSDELPRSTLKFPNYAGRHEAVYLKEISDSINIFLMDQKLVKPNGATSSIEFCDLLTSDYHLIHVKKYSSSSVLSHLFSQAFVSAEVLLHCPEIIPQINSYLPQSENFKFDENLLPRENKIIFAIMQEKAGELHMPFFSKVNLKQYSRQLKDMGFRVELLKIEY